MNPSARLGIGLAAAGAVALAGTWAWSRLRHWRRKDPAELERLRRLDINHRGRICAARILDLVEPEPGAPPSQMLIYKYEVAGVTYEVAQDITALPEVAAVAQYLPGQTASVKYDLRNPTNSIIACEEWTGIPDTDIGDAQPVEDPRAR